MANNKLVFDEVLKGKDAINGDLLERGKLIDSIKTIISLSPSKTFSLAVYGSWGTGKTNLLRMLKSEFEKDNLVVWFDTWKYESQPDLILPLLKKLYSEVPWKDLENKSKAFINNALAFCVDTAIKRILKTDIASIKKMFERQTLMVEAFEDEIELFCGEFEKYSTEILKRTKKKRIIIFFDDLDRCSPHSMVTLLESVKLFLSQGEKITFIYALDRDVVSKAISNKYSGIENFDGERYLEKIFDIFINIPKIDVDKSKSFINNLISDTGLALKPDQVEILSGLFQNDKVNTPRVAKKIINKILILQNAVSDEDKKAFESKFIVMPQEEMTQEIQEKIEKLQPGIKPVNINLGAIVANCFNLTGNFLGFIVLAESFPSFRNYIALAAKDKNFYETIKLVMLEYGELSKVYEKTFRANNNVDVDQFVRNLYIKHKNDIDTFYTKEFKKVFDSLDIYIVGDSHFENSNETEHYKGTIKTCIELEIYEEFMREYGL